MGNTHARNGIEGCPRNNAPTNATKERREEILAKIYHSEATEATSQRELSEDMIIEILSKLPTKSLMRFRFVCKRWYELSSSSTFIDIHLNNNLDKRKGSIFCSINSDLTIKDNMAIFVCANKATTNLHVPMFKRDLYIVGSCNGLVCLLSYQGDYTLWNPATEQYEHLPKLIYQGNNTLRNLRILFSISGFVFDPKSKDYKVVKITVKRDGDKGTPQVNFFTLSSRSWRTINLDHRFGDRMPYSKSVIVKKCIYWMELLLEEEINQSLLRCFDMIEEEFREIEVPCDLHGFMSNLDVYRGSLAMFVSKYPNDNFDMWVMNDHCDGTNYSWIKQLSIGPVPIITIEPIGFWIEDGDELLVIDTTGRGPKNLFTFHLITREIKKFTGDHPANQIFPYCESLVQIPKLN